MGRIRGVEFRDIIAKERKGNEGKGEEKKKVRLTAQVEMTGGVVQVGDDGFDIVEGHGLEFIVPQIEHVDRRCPGQEIRLESNQFVLA